MIVKSALRNFIHVLDRGGIMPSFKPSKCNFDEEIASSSVGPCTYRPINAEMKIGIWPPWDCLDGRPDLLTALKTQFGLSRIIAYPNQLGNLEDTGVWRNEDIMVSLNDLITPQAGRSADDLYHDFLNDIARIQDHVNRGGMYYGVLFDELFHKERTELFTEHASDIYRAIKSVHYWDDYEHRLRIFFGAYYINDASGKDVGYFRQVEDWADGLLYTRYVSDFLDGDQTGDWERLRNEYRDKITSGYIALPCSFDERGRSLFIKECDKDYLDYYLRRAREMFQNSVWVYADRAGFCSELWEQLAEVNRRIYHTWPRPSLAQALKGMDPELAYLVRKYGAGFNLRDCTTGAARDAICHMFCRRLQMLVDAAVRQGWMTQKCCQLRTISKTHYYCIRENCDECWNEYNIPIGPWRIVKDPPQTKLVCDDMELLDRRNWFAGCDEMFRLNAVKGEQNGRDSVHAIEMPAKHSMRNIHDVIGNTTLAGRDISENSGMEVFERKSSFIIRSKNILIPIIVLLILSCSCDMPTRHYPVKTYGVLILVVDSMKGIPLSDVLIIEKAEYVPDSNIVQADSMVMDYSKYVMWQRTGSDGVAWIGYYDADLSRTRVPVYDNYYAYHRGYRVWHYDSAKTRPIRLRTGTDSLYIELVRR